LGYELFFGLLIDDEGPLLHKWDPILLGPCLFVPHVRPDLAWFVLACLFLYSLSLSLSLSPARSRALSLSLPPSLPLSLFFSLSLFLSLSLSLPLSLPPSLSLFFSLFLSPLSLSLSLSLSFSPLSLGDIHPAALTATAPHSAKLATLLKSQESERQRLLRERGVRGGKRTEGGNTREPFPILHAVDHVFFDRPRVVGTPNVAFIFFDDTRHIQALQLRAAEALNPKP